MENVVLFILYIYLLLFIQTCKNSRRIKYDFIIGSKRSQVYIFYVTTYFINFL